MRHFMTAAFAMCIGAAICAPAYAKTGELIFPLQDMHVHSSTLVEAPNGDLIAAWFHGSGERTANDVVILGARKPAGSDAWSEVFPMAATHDLPDCNPVLFIDDRDRLWLYWVVAHSNRWERSVLKYRYADQYDGPGAPDWDWQDVILFSPGDAFAEGMRAGFAEINPYEPMWAEYALRYSRLLIEAAKDPVKRDMGWMTRASLLQLDSGRILLPLYSDGYNVSMIAYSDDRAETWRLSNPIVGLGNIQPSLAQRRDGTLVAYMRDNGSPPKRIQAATSADEGETWSVAHDIDIPNPGSSVAVQALEDGRWALVYNDAERGRHNLAVALSEDEGETWPWKRYLEESEPGSGNSHDYPSMIQARDGAIHLTYSHRVPEGRAIKHVRFDADWIKE